MPKYNPKKIERKWQKYWAEHPELFEADEKSEKEKFYCLDMFPYPSGDGLHVGHVEGYTASDIYSRYQRMKGKNVLHPMGWDAFGLPAENYAIKTGVHPDKSTHQNIKNFTGQIKSLGLSYDWKREIDTSNPGYYKWTQWFFLFLYKNGLAYRKKAKVNWCGSCQTVLANEQAEGGICERCKNEVIQKDLEQWFFKITDFAEELIEGLDKIDWPQSTKIAQKNWIGKSVGAEFELRITNYESGIRVYTTRLDTVYGMTYAVVSPEHPIIEKIKDGIENYKEVEKYINEAKRKTDLERTELQKEKTGVEIKGLRVINPFTDKEVPIFVADYVLSTYGTGAVMAVPAHDERDFEFAKKYNLPISQSITLDFESYEKTIKVLEALKEIYNEAQKENVKFWLLGGLANAFYAGIVYREHDDLDLIARDPASQEKMIAVLEKLGFEKIKEKKLTEKLTNFIFKNSNGIEVDIGPCAWEYGLKDCDFEEEIKTFGDYQSLVLSRKFLINLKNYFIKNRSEEKDKIDLSYLEGKVLTEKGFLVNSGKYSGLSSEKAREEMAVWLEKNNFGGRKTTYKIRDWLISRQRYWGSPIPMIYCEKCGWQPVSEKDLPVLLPEVKDYRPKGTSPLGTNSDFVNTVCPKCGAAAKRELDTMDTFVCSSWYFFRFSDPKNEKEFAGKEKIEKWLPVDLYIGGAEHTVLHLLYSRFFTKALHRHGRIDFDEPFKKLRHQGIVIAEDGRKMSKSLGNVINPDEIVKEYGADVLRLYEMFMGPLEDMKRWNTSSIIGLRRFLERVWRLEEKTQSTNTQNTKQNPGPKTQNTKINSLLHKTIKKVTEDIDNLRFNTAISAMMILVNEMEKEKELPIISYQLLNTILSPFAPHMAEEIWQEKLGRKESIFFEKWPEYDPKLVQDEEIMLIIQVNGKVRDQIKVPSGVKEEEAKKLALESQKIIKYTEGKDIRKIIFVKDRLINFVITH
ncbi:MAG: class I tRNA ligase family protein [Parcubacteria group bacterium]|jgi:leucyl-tRNA synthetase